MTAMTKPMTDTGERMVPETTLPSVFWEHVFRYAFACQRARGLAVLDIASGEGYGSNALSRIASRVVGVDISVDAVEYARAKYNLDFRVGSAEKIPIESASVDAVVSFETIEHVPNPKLFLMEVCRILKPNGIFILSTPNKDIYHRDQELNQFHCSEMTLNELLGLLAESFQVAELFGQTYAGASGLDKLQRFIGRLSYTLGLWTRIVIEKAVVNHFAPPLDTYDPVLRQKFVEKIPHLSTQANWLWNPYSIEKLSDSSQTSLCIFLPLPRSGHDK
jgi:SAM-dependent methyltransferase